MKKILISLSALALLSAFFWAWKPTTYSQTNLPYSNPDQDEPGLTACQKTVANQTYQMRSAWKRNLDALLSQEKPASEMVDEGFEGLRTYRCWLNSLCEAVRYSGNADPRATQKPGGGFRPLTRAEIETVPGCAAPENLRIPDLQIQYIPACKVVGGDQIAGTDTIARGEENVRKCHELIERDFANLPSDNPNKAEIDTFARDMSPAYLMLESALKSKSAAQEVRPLRDKFESILTKMQGLESHMISVRGQLETLDGRMSCYCSTCD